MRVQQYLIQVHNNLYGEACQFGGTSRRILRFPSPAGIDRLLPCTYNKYKTDELLDKERSSITEPNELEVFQDLYEELSNAYFEGKRELNPETASTYQKNRLEIGQMSREFARKAMEPLTEKENLTLEANEKLAQENEVRTRGDREAAEDLAANGPVLQ